MGNFWMAKWGMNMGYYDISWLNMIIMINMISKYDVHVILMRYLC